MAHIDFYVNSLYNCTMNDVVVDASALLCILLREPEWKSIAKALDQYNLVGTASLPMEIGNCLSALYRRDLIDEKDGIAVWEEYLKLPIRFMKIPFEKALLLAFNYKIYAYDAYVLALAEKGNIPLITLDRSMQIIAEKIGIHIPEV